MLDEQLDARGNVHRFVGRRRERRQRQRDADRRYDDQRDRQEIVPASHARIVHCNDTKRVTQASRSTTRDVC